jgi:hypothetical protein
MCRQHHVGQDLDIPSLSGGAGEGVRTLDVHLGKGTESVTGRNGPFQVSRIADRGATWTSSPLRQGGGKSGGKKDRRRRFDERLSLSGRRSGIQSAASAFPTSPSAIPASENSPETRPVGPATAKHEAPVEVKVKSLERTARDFEVTLTWQTSVWADPKVVSFTCTKNSQSQLAVSQLAINGMH